MRLIQHTTVIATCVGLAILAAVPARGQQILIGVNPTPQPDTFPEAIAVDDPLRSSIGGDDDDVLSPIEADAPLGPDGEPVPAEDGALRTRVIETDPDAVAEARQGRPVEAEPPPQLEFVADRQRAELEALGLRAGSFILYSEVVTAIEATDNVFSTDAGKVGDARYVARPRLRAQSDWNRHELVFDYEGEYGAYDTYDSENPEQTSFATTGRLDVTQSTALSGRARYAIEQEGRGSVESPAGASSPTRREAYGFGGAVSQRHNRLTAALRGGVDIQDYEDGTDAAGALIDNSDRDQSETSLGGRLTYEVSPATSVYADGEYRWRDHDRAFDNSGFARDAERQTATLGASFEPLSLIRAEIAVGYVHEDIDDARLDPLDEIAVDGSIAWAVTPLTTVTAGYATAIASTTVAGASGSVGRTASVGVDHEFLRNFVMGTAFSHEHIDYRGTGLEEETITASLSGEYWVTRYAALMGGYEYSRQTTNDGTGPIGENTVSVGLKLRP